MATPTLILIEHDRGQVKRPSLHAMTPPDSSAAIMRCCSSAADLDEMARTLTGYGAAAVIVADDAALAEPLADRYAKVIADACAKTGASTLLATSSTFSKDILPRAAALLDAPMLTDVVAIEEKEGAIFTAGRSAPAACSPLVQLQGDKRVLTIRAAAFAAPASDAAASPVEKSGGRRRFLA